jgi:hypothetical protein
VRALDPPVPKKNVMNPGAKRAENFTAPASKT